MKTAYDKALPILVVSLFLISAIPAVTASTFTVTLNPTSRIAHVVSKSSTSIILTYPSTSGLSQALNGYNSTTTLSGSFSGSSDPAQKMQGRFAAWDHDIRIQNMSVVFTRKALANVTALVVSQETDIAASVSGVFTVENGSVHANLGWRSYSVPGSMTLNLENHEVEVNQVGSAMSDQLDGHPIFLTMLLGMFGADGLWHRGMLNFSSLNSPLSTWTKSYDSSTNTTTFSKTISGEASLNVQADYNGQKYTLSMKSDPSASIATAGYASASADSLSIGEAAPETAPPMAMIAIGAAVAVVVAGALLYSLRRSRVKTSALQSQPSTAAASQ